MKNIIFTIGHSTHSIEKFIELLKLHEINAIADVRSSPFSKMNPQFNREELKESMRDVGINYVFLGKELGARSNDPNCYINNKVQYEKIEKTDLFKSGINRVIEGSYLYRAALMCAEKEPLDCHRTILISRNLIKHGLDVKHVLADGSFESHEEVIERLMESFDIARDDMFLSNDEIQDIAYKKQAEKIAYIRDEHKSNIIDRDFDSVSPKVNQ